MARVGGWVKWLGIIFRLLVGTRSLAVWAAVYEKVVSNYPGLVIPGQSGADDIVMMVM